MGHTNAISTQNDQEILYHLKQDIHTRRKGEELLFRTYAYFIQEGMKKYHLGEEDAFDAYSETILTAVAKIDDSSFQGNSTLKTFLYSIFQHKCVDIIRKNATNKYSVHQTVSISDVLMELSDSAATIIQTLVNQSDFGLLRQRLNELGEKCKQLLMLSADGYTDKEITQELEYKTADVVKTSRLRCLDKLRQLYKTP